MKIGLQFAMVSELHALPGAQDLEPFETISGIPFFQVAPDIIACAGGISKVNAAMAAEIFCLRYGVDMIINSGVAGCATDLPTNALVIASEFIQHDVDTTAIGDEPGLISGINKVYFEADADAVNAICEIAASLGIKTHCGTIASGDRFVASAAEKERITSLFGAVCCEMEGGSVGHVCYVNGVPFAVIRAISDDADGGACEDYPAFAAASAKKSAAIVINLAERLAKKA